MGTFQMGVVCTLVLMTAVVVESQTMDGAKSQYKQKIPGDNDGYYDDSNYLMTRVLGAAAVGVAIAVFSCIIGCCFCCVQLCSKVCGDENCCKRNCSCCGAGKPPEEGYTQKQRLIMVGVLFLGFAFIVVGSGLGYDGNAKVKDGIDEFYTTAEKLADEIYDQVVMGYDAAVAVESNDVDASMKTDAEKLRKDVKDGVKLLRDNDKIRVLIVYVFYGIMMIVPVLGFLAWLFGSSKFSYVMTQVLERHEHV